MKQPLQTSQPASCQVLCTEFGADRPTASFEPLIHWMAVEVLEYDKLAGGEAGVENTANGVPSTLPLPLSMRFKGRAKAHASAREKRSLFLHQTRARRASGAGVSRSGRSQSEAKMEREGEPT